MFVSNNSCNTFEIRKDHSICFVLTTQPMLEFRGTVLDVNPNSVMLKVTSVYDRMSDLDKQYMRDTGGGRMTLQFSDFLSMERIHDEKG